MQIMYLFLHILPPRETLTERFYVLEGLTAYVFLGRHILDKIDAFTRYQAVLF